MLADALPPRRQVENPSSAYAVRQIFDDEQVFHSTGPAALAVGFARRIRRRRSLGILRGVDGEFVGEGGACLLH